MSPKSAKSRRSRSPAPARRAKPEPKPADQLATQPAPERPAVPTPIVVSPELQQIRELLAAPFSPADLEWRVQRAGHHPQRGPWARVVAYVTNRAIQTRLDDVFGISGWKNEYREVRLEAAADGKRATVVGFLCGLSVHLPTFTAAREWVTKWDGADLTDIEALKGGLSDSMKRCGVQLGIGRYLYDLEEAWAVVREDGRFFGEYRDGDTRHTFRWDPPALPAWALPTGASETARRRLARPDTRDSSGDGGATVSTRTTSAQGQPAAARPSAPTERKPAPAVSDADAKAAKVKWLTEFHRLLSDPVVTDEDREHAKDWLKENVDCSFDVLREQCDKIRKGIVGRKRRASHAAALAGQAPAAPAKPAEPSKPAASSAEIPVSERATKAQRELYLKMMRSHVFSDAERKFAQVACDDPMLSKTDLSGLIDNSSKVSKQRKAEEKAREASGAA